MKLHKPSMEHLEILESCINTCDECIVACEQISEKNVIGLSAQEEEGRYQTTIDASHECIETCNECIEACKEHLEFCKIDDCKERYQAAITACNNTVKQCGHVIRALETESKDYLEIADECIKACDATAEAVEYLLGDEEEE